MGQTLNRAFLSKSRYFNLLVQWCPIIRSLMVLVKSGLKDEQVHVFKVVNLWARYLQMLLLIVFILLLLPRGRFVNIRNDFQMILFLKHPSYEQTCTSSTEKIFSNDKIVFLFGSSWSEISKRDIKQGVPVPGDPQSVQ